MQNTPDPSKPPRLLDQVVSKMRVKHYSLRTEKSYADWIKRYILHHGKRHPKDMGAAEVEAFLTHLAVARNVSASTQNQAKSALLFLYKEVLEIDLPWLDNVTQAKAPKRLPVVLLVTFRLFVGVSLSLPFDDGLLMQKIAIANHYASASFFLPQSYPT